MEKLKSKIQKIFQAKLERRKQLARLPVEKKFEILLHLQKIAWPVYQMRGLNKKPWKLS